MRRMGVLAVAAFSALGGTAEAATLTADKACYLERETVRLTGTGFTPGAPVSLSLGGRAAGEPAADGDGTVFAELRAPFLGERGAKRYTVSAGDGVNTAATKIAVTQRQVRISPTRARLDRPVLYRVRGLKPNRAVYVHYVYRGKERMRRRLGRTGRPCGTLTKRARFFPRGEIGPGTWTLQFDHRRRYSPRTTPRIREPVRVFRAARASAGRYAAGR